ncbi:MAG TPA: hypothetical protein VLM38_10160 [Blastocatellia bacterium]|nr:hypothetical protein [Blastocatellia bacterium]
MKPFIRITRHPYEEPYHVNLVVAASNGRQLGELEIYANADDLAMIARELRGYPKRTGDIVLWELGSERPEDRFAFYYRLRVFQVAATGQCAVELRFNNNQAPPDREVVEFSIPALPSDLDRFAILLEGFSRLEHRLLEWSIDDGALREDV